ncbi:hypothetical protein [Mesorhizobium sp.]|uniref:hypothetical protein n=1 Tax=Mesorhizobium sp. TaxID=1871066 RepID=UPI000FE9C63C|nr:hypothetical protein [Mesorhizobium sp.]RWO21013.1 MAG: hypothetical protein EOS09_25550 [Mesorhizobium sp.]
MATLQRNAQKLFYYARNAVRDIAPQALFRRRLAGLLVLYKYFVLSGQIEPDPEVWRFISG